MPSPKFLKILQKIGLNHGNAHVKLFQWYIFGLGAIGKSLSLIWPIFHFPIIFLIILSCNLFSNVHVHMCIFSLTHGRLQLTLWVKFWFLYDIFGLAAPSEKITPIMGITPIYWGWLLEEYLVYFMGIIWNEAQLKYSKMNKIGYNVNLTTQLRW